MRTISTGEPSTLATYKKIAFFFGKEAQAFIDAQIRRAPNGADEEVIADERQVLYLLANIKVLPEVNLFDDKDFEI